MVQPMVLGLEEAKVVTGTNFVVTGKNLLQPNHRGVRNKPHQLEILRNFRLRLAVGKLNIHKRVALGHGNRAKRPSNTAKLHKGFVEGEAFAAAPGSPMYPGGRTLIQKSNSS